MRLVIQIVKLIIMLILLLHGRLVLNASQIRLLDLIIVVAVLVLLFLRSFLAALQEL